MTEVTWFTLSSSELYIPGKPSLLFCLSETLTAIQTFSHFTMTASPDLYCSETCIELQTPHLTSDTRKFDMISECAPYQAYRFRQTNKVPSETTWPDIIEAAFIKGKPSSGMVWNNPTNDSRAARNSSNGPQKEVLPGEDMWAQRVDCDIYLEFLPGYPRDRRKSMYDIETYTKTSFKPYPGTQGGFQGPASL